jgi:hypothetical protein
MKIDSAKVLNTLKIIGMVMGVIIVFTLLMIPYVAAYKYLKGKNQKVVIHPEFKIVDVVDNNDIDPDVLSSAVRLGKECLERINSTKKEEPKVE